MEHTKTATGAMLLWWFSEIRSCAAHKILELTGEDKQQNWGLSILFSKLAAPSNDPPRHSNDKDSPTYIVALSGILTVRGFGGACH